MSTSSTSSTKSLRPTLHFVGANGFLGGAYEPLLDHLHHAYGYETGYTDVWDCCAAQDGTWDKAIHKIVRDIETRASATPAPVPAPSAVGGRSSGHGAADTVVAVGHSMGGAMLYLAAVRRPDLFKRLIVVDAPMFSWPKRLLLALGRQLPFFDRLHPLIRSTYRKKATFVDRAEATQYFRSRRAFRKFDARCVDALVRHGLRPARQGGGMELVFGPAQERWFYMTTPYDVFGPGKMGQYQATTVPGAFLYSDSYGFLQRSDVEDLKRALRSLHFVPFRGSHFLPMEQPEHFADLTHRLLAQD